MAPPSDVSPGDPATTAERSGTGSDLARLLVLIGAVGAALHFFSGWYPSSANWGTHHLAFFPAWLRIAVPLLMLAALLPPVQRQLSPVVDRFVARLRPGPLLLVVALVLLAGLFWFARERTYFLGDGYLDLRRIRDLDVVEHLHFRFENEPLAGLIAWHLYRILTGWNIAGADALSFQLISIAAGIVAVAAMVVIVRALAAGATERFLMLLVLLASGGTQLFFGYVENYPLAYALILLYGAGAVWYLRGRLPLVVPALLFALLLATQLGMAVLGPSLLYLAWVDLKKRRYVLTLASLLAAGILFALLMYSCGYTWEVLSAIGSRGGGHLLGFLAPANERQPYAFLSIEHFTELGNLHFLVNPFALVVVLRLVTLRVKGAAGEGRIWRFWMVTALFALAASLVLHWDLGMSRDWDILALFSLPLIPASLAGIAGAVGDLRRRANLLLMIGATMLLHTIPWIAVNADTERSLDRIAILPERAVWGTTAWKAFLEELAIHFRDNNRPADAAGCYEQYLAIDSMNPRIWANYAYVCGETGADDKALSANEQAARYGSTWYGVYANLGNMYARRDRVDEAVAMLKKSLALNPAQPVVLNAVSSLLLERRESLREAMGYFAASLAIDSASASTYLNAGLCAAEMHDAAGARRYYEKFLALAPDHPRAGEVRERLRALR